MRTLQNIFLEIDEKIHGGAYRRFGPFLETSELIDGMNKNKFQDVVVGIDNLEINYSSLNKLRSDLKEFGIFNYFNEKYLIKDKDGKVIKKSENLNLLIDKTSWNRLKLIK